MTDRAASTEDLRAARWLRWAVAFVWLATGVLWVHPEYRAVGGGYLARLGLPLALMPATCLFEVGLAFVVAFGPTSRVVTALQVGMIAGFTAILGALEPMLLVSPFGMLTKNLPIVACVSAAFLIEREGFTPRARRLLRVGMAVIWLTEGLFPKVLFQQQVELAIAASLHLSRVTPSTILTALGLVQIASGVLALTLSGRWLRAVLAAQVGALVALMIVMTWLDPVLWAHPFGPLTKNAPILIGTLVVRRRCCS